MTFKSPTSLKGSLSSFLALERGLPSSTALGAGAMLPRLPTCLAAAFIARTEGLKRGLHHDPCLSSISLPLALALSLINRVYEFVTRVADSLTQIC